MKIQPNSFTKFTATAREDNLLCRAGEQVPMHKFHRMGHPAARRCFWGEPSGKQWRCAYHTDTLYAGFPHFHFTPSLSWHSAFGGLQKGDTMMEQMKPMDIEKRSFAII